MALYSVLCKNVEGKGLCISFIIGITTFKNKKGSSFAPLNSIIHFASGKQLLFFCIHLYQSCSFGCG
jgi:hypothetical protein